jgi:hypothetical protein
LWTWLCRQLRWLSMRWTSLTSRKEEMRVEGEDAELLSVTENATQNRNKVSMSGKRPNNNWGMYSASKTPTSTNDLWWSLLKEKQFNNGMRFHGFRLPVVWKAKAFSVSHQLSINYYDQLHIIIQTSKDTIKCVNCHSLLKEHALWCSHWCLYAYLWFSCAPRGIALSRPIVCFLHPES